MHGKGIPNGTGNPMGMVKNIELGMGMQGNGKPPQWDGNYLHSHGNLFPPKILCCGELIKLLVLYLPDVNAYCAEFAD